MTVICVIVGWPAPSCRFTWGTSWTPSSTPTLRCGWLPSRWWCSCYSKAWSTQCRSVILHVYTVHVSHYQLLMNEVDSFKFYSNTCMVTWYVSVHMHLESTYFSECEQIVSRFLSFEYVLVGINHRLFPFSVCSLSNKYVYRHRESYTSKGRSTASRNRQKISRIYSCEYHTHLLCEDKRYGLTICLITGR